MDYIVKITQKRGIARDVICIVVKLYFLHFDLEIDVLTLKMILNHENNIRKGFSSKKYTKLRYYAFS